jgi:hypothetical protein
MVRDVIVSTGAFIRDSPSTRFITAVEIGPRKAGCGMTMLLT